MSASDNQAPAHPHEQLQDSGLPNQGQGVQSLPAPNNRALWEELPDGRVVQIPGAFIPWEPHHGDDDAPFDSRYNLPTPEYRKPFFDVPLNGWHIRVPKPPRGNLEDKQCTIYDPTHNTFTFIIDPPVRNETGRMTFDREVGRQIIDRMSDAPRQVFYHPYYRCYLLRVGKPLSVEELETLDRDPSTRALIQSWIDEAKAADGEALTGADGAEASGESAVAE